MLTKTVSRAVGEVKKPQEAQKEKNTQEHESSQ